MTSVINGVTGWLMTILPIFLLVVAVIYRHKIKKVVVEFLFSTLITFLLMLVAGFTVAVLQISIWLIIILFIGLAVLYRIAKLNLKDVAYVVIFLAMAFTYLITGSINNYFFIICIISVIVIMVMNILGIGKDDSIPYK